VAERRVPQVVGQATGADNGSDFFQNFRIFDLYLLLFQELADLISERTSYTSYFKAVSQTVVNKNITRKGKYLRFIL